MNASQAYMIAHVGKPYRWGGDDPIAGFDCSGFAQEFLAMNGIYFPTDMTAESLFQWCLTKKFLPLRQMGALAFYGSELKKTHIAVMFDNDRIFEFGGGGLKTLTLDDAIKQNAFGRIRYVGRRQDLMAIYYPNYPFGV